MARAAVKEAGQNAAKNPEAESSVAQLVEKQTALKAATNQVQVAKNLVVAAETRSTELTKQVKSLTEISSTAAGKLKSATAAVAESTRPARRRKRTHQQARRRLRGPQGSPWGRPRDRQTLAAISGLLHTYLRHNVPACSDRTKNTPFMTSANLKANVA